MTQIDQSESGETYFRSQHGEDRLLNLHFAGKKTGFFVEVGAYDGELFSNTYYFEKLGWTGILIEPNPEAAEHCRRLRTGSVVVPCAVVSSTLTSTVCLDVVEGREFLSSLLFPSAELFGKSSHRIRRVEVPAKTLDQILEESSVTRIDFISIDVEGYELEVLEGFSLSHFRPEIVLIERNEPLPNKRIIRKLKESDYLYWRRTGVNDWFYLGQRGQGKSFQYRLFLIYRLYLPAYSKHIVKIVLDRMGLLGVLKAVLRRFRARS